MPIEKAHRNFFYYGLWELVHSSWIIEKSSGSRIWNVRSYKPGGKRMHHAGMAGMFFRPAQKTVQQGSKGHRPSRLQETAAFFNECTTINFAP